MNYQSGRHFLQIPGPTNVPDRVLRALAAPTIDHRGPGFSRMTREILDGLRGIFKTAGSVVVYPSSGTGAWESSLVNTLSPGDKVLMFETGHFAAMWKGVASRMGLEVEFVPGDWRHGVAPAAVEARLAEDRGRAIKAVAIVHNETSTGVVSPVAEIRRAIDKAGHPALFLVDTISSLASMDYRHDDWGVDVTVCCSQKGLMLPPGLGFNAVSAKALAAAKSARLPRSYWDWESMMGPNKSGFFPYTPSTNLLYGLREALLMLQEEGLDNVFARHARLAEAARRAVKAWNLELVAAVPAEYSSTVTAVFTPAGHDADAFRKVALERFNLSLGNGLGKVQGKVFRIGHLGDFNELMLAGTLCGVEMALAAGGVPFSKGGVLAALEYLAAK
ncbi:MAG TPA: aminotransferase class V-fold PLP-dependent enzyme [Thermodesulfobacteriota bacterium]|nr:aminotransferase class V-fold PLP-dependent enzyme [Thermodesulfobacteriota bacterium]